MTLKYECSACTHTYTHSHLQKSVSVSHFHSRSVFSSPSPSHCCDLLPTASLYCRNTKKIKTVNGQKCSFYCTDFPRCRFPPYPLEFESEQINKLVVVVWLEEGREVWNSLVTSRFDILYFWARLLILSLFSSCSSFPIEFHMTLVIACIYFHTSVVRCSWP